MELSYATSIDSEALETWAHPSPALAEAQRVKRENIDAIVTIDVLVVTSDPPVAAVCPDCFGAVGVTHSPSCRWRGTAVLTHQAVYRPAEQARRS